jgi:uncharacterized protein (DUF885 family)
MKPGQGVKNGPSSARDAASSTSVFESGLALSPRATALLAHKARTTRQTKCSMQAVRYSACMRIVPILLVPVLSIAASCGAHEPRPAKLATKTPTSDAEKTPPAPVSVAPSRSPLADQAVSGVDDASLRELLAEHWEMAMRWNPTDATTLGDHRYDALLPRRDAASIVNHRGERDDLLKQARSLPAASFNERDKITLELFVGELAADAAQDVCREHEWRVSARENTFAQLSYMLSEGHQVRTLDDARNLISRLTEAPRLIADEITNLRAGAALGFVAPAEGIRRAVAQLDGELAKDVDAWELSRPAKAEHSDWPKEELETFRAKHRALVRDQVRPAVVRLRDALRDELMPKGRAGQDEGLKGLPRGEACYSAMILTHLGNARAARELHQLGLDQIAKSDRELATLGKKLFRSKDLKATLERLRTDPKLYFASSAELLASAEKSLARAQNAVPNLFGTLPKTPCVVREIPAHEAPYTTIAYYRAPYYDGSKPGEYFVNTFKPETRPRYDFQALSFHESVPGHHLQIASAQELGAVPLFRKLGGSTAFIEGWGLYSERLADELKLYDSDLDRVGMWSYDAWRSARLVVDTGMHALGWTRAQAETFMREHTALSSENISNEVDRYLSTPGQALAYKVGQLEFLSLRAEAEKALGDRFDVRMFHDTVLGLGAVTLPILRAHVQAWIASQGAAVSAAATSKAAQ